MVSRSTMVNINEKRVNGEPVDNNKYKIELKILSANIKMNKKYYPQILLEKSKYAVNKNNKIKSEELKLNSGDDESDETSETNKTDLMNMKKIK